jgi:ATP-binding cassette subfamily B protein
LTPSALVSFFLYGLLLRRPVSVLATTYEQIQQVRGSTARLHEALHASPETCDEHHQDMPAVSGTITLCGLSFAYPGRPTLLRDVSVTIPAGEIVALIGPNGAGKSTLAHLLMRFYRPQAGQIYIDGLDIATVSLTSLRRHIGLVSQHPLLFNGTVRANLALGKPHATQAEIETAARAARAHDFITQLPAGYDTCVGDNGVKLSGGQQQRLALARALLKNPPILILDEATSLYDPEGERQLLLACRALLRQRTVLLITHRPAPLALADRILRLEHGTIYEDSARQRDRTYV